MRIGKVIVPAVIILLIAAFLYGRSAPNENTYEEIRQAVSEPSPAPSETPTKIKSTPIEQPSEQPSELPEAEADTGKPEASPTVEPTPAPVSEEPEPENICTISISCEKALSSDSLPAETAEILPESGWILAPTDTEFSDGESVFDVLQKICRQSGIHLEFSSAPGYGSVYIEGIGNLYEFDCGGLSGWMYSVNGYFPNYGCSLHTLHGGDIIKWEYTCDLGEDLGASFR